ncbi:hypothetical protein SAMN02799624_00413 [Paenibacillus sp. UNC496MF]|uniref:hypothetical protein n=1 Tax=Paenibacillus sp. UNC496MF TaxID=1502753 RepID=UPI0008EC0A3E|nr:hypothetical protein [Paenibacillus sp. UNC496MF]SFI33256.1 hypothetical protein SAMN02799624_00413 [Paenibacillus sp. UNC496MF]
MGTNDKDAVPQAANAAHPYYRHAEQAFRLLPGAVERLTALREAFRAADEDFLAVELKTMIARLEEIRALLADGPQG